jgi:PAS domain S-box-containing protein
VAHVTTYPGELVVTAIINFIFMNAAASLSVSVLVKGLLVSHDREIRLATSLEEKQKRLAGEILGRRQANQARAESEQRYRNILDSIEDGYFEVDLEGHITFFNGALTRLLGISGSKLSGMNHAAFMDGANAGKLARAFKHTYDTGESSQVLDCQLTRKDGSRCDIEMVVSLIRDRQGTDHRFQGNWPGMCPPGSPWKNGCARVPKWNPSAPWPPALPTTLTMYCT